MSTAAFAATKHVIMTSMPDIATCRVAQTYIMTQLQGSIVNDYSSDFSWTDHEKSEVNL